MTTDGLDAALEAVDEHASEEWKQKANDCLDWLIRSCALWTNDDFWNAMEKYYPEVTTHEPRALGPQTLRRVRAGEIERVGRVLSTRSVAHKADIPVYGRPGVKAAMLTKMLAESPEIIADVVVFNARVEDLERYLG